MRSIWLGISRVQTAITSTATVKTYWMRANWRREILIFGVLRAMTEKLE
jgi:hypothetical protein